MSFAHVQGLATHGVITGANTFVATVGDKVGSGNCVIGGIISVPNGITITSVQDDQGNTYTVKDSLNDATDSHQIFSFELGNITNAPHIITITFGSGSGNPVQVVIDEYSGALAAADPTDGHAIVLRTAPGTGANAITSTSITTTVNGDLIYGVCFDQGTATPASTAGTSPLSFTLRGSDLDPTDAFSVVSEDAVQSAAGSVNTAFTNSTTGGGDNFAVIIIAVKPAAGAAVVEQPPSFNSRTFPFQWNLNRRLLSNTAQDQSSFGVETNPHWRGRTWALQCSPLRALMQNSDPNAPFAQPETNTFFNPRTWLIQWKPLPLGRITAQDFISSSPETNPHWRGQAWPLQWCVQQSLWQTAAADVSVQVGETNPQCWVQPHVWPLRWNFHISLLLSIPQDFSSLPPVSQPVYARFGASHGIVALSAIPGYITS